MKFIYYTYINKKIGKFIFFNFSFQINIIINTLELISANIIFSMYDKIFALYPWQLVECHVEE